jgi:hypothetical protein
MCWKTHSGLINRHDHRTLSCCEDKALTPHNVFFLLVQSGMHHRTQFPVQEAPLACEETGTKWKLAQSGETTGYLAPGPPGRQRVSVTLAGTPGTPGPRHSKKAPSATSSYLNLCEPSTGMRFFS